MRYLAVVFSAIAALFIAVFLLIYFMPGMQDRIIQGGLTRQIARAANPPYIEDDALHILICGTGSPMLDLTRVNACAAVIAGGHVVIIDTGPGSWSKLAAANVPAAKVDTVLLTHLHSDHIGDLGELATQSWLGGRKVPLEVYGPPAPDGKERTTDAEGETFGTSGTEQVVKGFAEAYNADAEFRIAQGHELVPTEGARMIGHDIPKPGPEEAVTVYDKDGLKIEAFLVNHDPAEPAYGYRIDYGGRAAVISGDTTKVRNMVRFSKGADVLVHEALSNTLVGMLASALDENGNERQGTMARQIMSYHTTPIEAADIAEEAEVPLLVLTHLVPPLRNALMRRMFLAGAKEARGPGGDIILAKDGLLITLPKGSKDISTKNLL
jgi:ribonuclease Z